MKKKFLTFVLALIFVIPCMFAIAGCGEKPEDPHKHAYTHGLCDCGHYTGTTFEANSTETFDAIEIGETDYYRFAPTIGQHYRFSKGLASTVKMYAKYGKNWVDLTYLFADEYIANSATADGYVYLEFKNETDHNLSEFAFIAEELNHYYQTPVQVAVNGDVSLEESMACIETKTALTAGTTYKVTISADGQGQPVYQIVNIFNTDGLVECDEISAFECTFTATKSCLYYIHISCHSIDPCTLTLEVVE